MIDGNTAIARASAMTIRNAKSQTSEVRAVHVGVGAGVALNCTVQGALGAALSVAHPGRDASPPGAPTGPSMKVVLTW